MRTAALLVAVVALTSACDSADPNTTTQPSEGAREQDADDPEAADELEREHHGRGRHGSPAEHLCGKLDCTDEQAAEIEALFERPDRARPDDSAANEALATAFRGDAFSAADLETYMKASRPDDRAAEHVQKLEALHAILTPEQRASFADEIQENGFMGGRGKHDRKWEKKGGGEAGAKFVAHKVEKLCAPLSCTDDQEQKIAAIVAQAKAERPEPSDRDHTALADAMRAETFDTAAVQKELEAAKAQHEERHAGKADALVAIHGVLDANQRDMVADRIEAEGPTAILGHRGGPRGDKHGKFGKKRARG